MERAAGSPEMTQLIEGNQKLLAFFGQSAWSRRAGDPQIADFVVGNPHEAPLDGVVEALQGWSVPRDTSWFAYKRSEPVARETVASSLRERFDVPYDPDDIFMTNGGAAAITVALRATVSHGDEVIFLSPPWFFYDALIRSSGTTPVRVNVDRESFDLDLAAIEAAISSRTRAIIVNSPQNPTGKIYSAQTLTRLADILERASLTHGRTIYLLSDEAYNRIVFDDRQFRTPTAFYPNSFLLYTYGKTLLTPGQRMGYIALPPSMPTREQLRTTIMLAQFITGYAFPNALLQHALPDLERLSIDIGHLQRKRDLVVGSLREMGYHVHIPEGTFYLLPVSPLDDDLAFTELLAEQDVFVLPGSMVELPGYFRVSLTASDEMIERALPRFASVMRQIQSRNPHSRPVPHPVQSE